MKLGEAMSLVEGKTYQNNAYQCYAACHLALLRGKYRTCVLGSGQGKSWIIILLANYLVMHKSAPEVVILTTSKLVASQLRSDLELHLPDYCGTKIKVYLLKNTLELYEHAHPKAALIFDEADEIMEKYMFALTDSGEIDGLADIGQRTAYFFTATLNVYFKKAAKIVFDDP